MTENPFAFQHNIKEILEQNISNLLERQYDPERFPGMSVENRVILSELLEILFEGVDCFWTQKNELILGTRENRRKLSLEENRLILGSLMKLEEHGLTLTFFIPHSLFDQLQTPMGGELLINKMLFEDEQTMVNSAKTLLKILRYYFQLAEEEEFFDPLDDPDVALNSKLSHVLIDGSITMAIVGQQQTT